MAPVQVPKSHDQADQSSFGRSVQLLKDVAGETTQSPGTTGNGPTLLYSIQRVEKTFRNLPKAQQKDQALLVELGEALAAVVGVDDATFETACKEACSFMTSFARVWAFQGARWAVSVLPVLAKKHGAHEAMTAAVAPTMCALISHCWDEHGHLLLTVLELMQDEQMRPSTLRQFYELVKIVIEKWPPSAVEEHKNRLGQRFADDLRSADIERANTSQHHFPVLARKWPDVGTKVFKCLSKQLQGQLLQRHPLVQAHLNIKQGPRKAAGSTPSPAGSVDGKGKSLPPHPHKLGMGPAEYQQRRVVKEGSQLDKLVQWKKRKDHLAADAIQDIVADTASISTENSQGSLGRSRNAEALALSAKRHEELKKRKLNMMSPTLRHHLTADAKNMNTRIPGSDGNKEAKSVMAMALPQDHLTAYMSPAEAKTSRQQPPAAEAKGEQDTIARREELDMKAAAEPPTPCAYDTYGRLADDMTIASERPPQSKLEGLQEMDPDEMRVVRRHVSFDKTPTVINNDDNLAWTAEDTWCAADSSMRPQDEPVTLGSKKSEASVGEMLQDNELENFELAGLRTLDTYEMRPEEEEVPPVNLTGFMAQEGDEAEAPGEDQTAVHHEDRETEHGDVDLAASLLPCMEELQPLSSQTRAPGSTRRWAVPLFFGFFALAALVAAILMDHKITVELSNMVWGPNKDARPTALVSDQLQQGHQMKPPQAVYKAPDETAKKSSKEDVQKEDKEERPAPHADPGKVGQTIIKAPTSSIARMEVKVPPKRVAVPVDGRRGAAAVPPMAPPAPPTAASGPAPSFPSVVPKGGVGGEGRPSFGRRVHNLSHKIFTKKNALLGLMMLGIMLLFGMP